MLQRTLTSLALFAAAAGATTAAQAQSNVTLYGRLDLSIAQRADAVENIDLRNGSGSRLGVRGVEDLGDGLYALFRLEHRFDADTGSLPDGKAFWDGASYVGLGYKGVGDFTVGRQENPAYTYGQVPADPFGTDTVAGNGSIISGRIGSTRWSNAGKYEGKFGAFKVGAMVAEGDGGDRRPIAVGGMWSDYGFTVGAGYEGTSNDNASWATINMAYKFGPVSVGGLFGTGKNTSDEKHRGWLANVKADIGLGTLRATYGQLKNRDTDTTLDDQFGIGYVYPLSKRTSVYADITHEKRDGIENTDNKKTGWDIGLRHNF